MKAQILPAIRQLRRLVQEQADQGQGVEVFFQPKKINAGNGAALAPTRKPALPQSPALAELAKNVQACTQCPLAATRRQIVFGEGDEKAELVFIGDAPGAEEEREGRLFAGEAGNLLNKMLAALSLKREQVYLCNLLKCRLPENRNPLAAEIAACRPHLIQQLEQLQPRLICALGSFAAQMLLDTEEPLGKLRGRPHAFKGIPVIATFHPAALLYHPQNKRPAWEDLKLIAQILNLKIAGNKNS